MAMLPVICDNCGAVWGTPNIIGGSGANVKMTGSKAGPCPVCGGIGSIPDGVYDLMDDALTVVGSAALPAATLQVLIDLLESRARGEVTDAEVIKRVEAEAPTLVTTVKAYLQKTDPVSWISLLVTILAMQGGSKSPSAEDVARALREKPVPALVAPQKPGAAQGRTPPAKKATKRKRTAKTYGKNKKRRPRGSKKQRR